MRNLGAYTTVKRLIAETTATTSPTAVTIDRATVNNRRFEALTLALHVGAGGITFTGTNYIALKLEESDDNSSYQVVGAGGSPAVVLGSSNPAGTNFAQNPDANGFVRLINAAKAAADTDPFTVDYTGNKRYLKVTIVFGGTHATGTLVGLYGVLGYPDILPAP